ncbi:MAG: hypothetical protein WCR55_14775, partial [Lentisphaerota bacterium]
LLKWGLGVAFNGETANNLYVLLIATISRLSDGSLLSINALFIFQMILGVLTVVFVVYTAWLMFNSKVLALIAGLLTALYAPLLMYEGFILKTSLIVFLSTGLIFSSISFYRGNKKSFSITCSGIFAGLLLTANFGSLCLVIGVYAWLIYTNLKFQKKSYIFAVFPSSLIAVLILFFVATGFKSFPIINGLLDSRWQEYIFNVGNQRHIASLNEPVEDANNQTVKPSEIDVMPYLKKTGMIFSSEEVPDNINYCFIRDGIFPLKYMLSPFLLYSLAIPSLLIFFCFYREGLNLLLVGISLICMAIPLIIFVPLSRYTVFYAPILCIVTAWGISFLGENILRKNSKVVLVVFLFFIGGFYLQTMINPFPVIRASDFIAYANALEMQDPSDSKIDYAYEQAYLSDSDSVSHLGYNRYSNEKRQQPEFSRMQRANYKIPNYLKEDQPTDSIYYKKQKSRD